MVVSDTENMIDELTIALLTSILDKSGQDPTLGNALQNRIQHCKSWFTKLHTTLGKVQLWARSNFGQGPTLGNVLYKITYDFVSPDLQNCIRLWARLDKIQLQATCSTKSHSMTSFA